jgi:hypothetical protein
MGAGQAVRENVLDKFDDIPWVHYTGLLAQVVDTLVFHFKSIIFLLFCNCCGSVQDHLKRHISRWANTIIFRR